MEIYEAHTTPRTHEFQSGELYIVVVGQLYRELLALPHARITIKIRHTINQRTLRQSLTPEDSRSIQKLVEKITTRLEIDYTLALKVIEDLKHYLQRYRVRWNIEENTMPVSSVPTGLLEE